MTTSGRCAHERAVAERAAPHARLGRHLFVRGTTASPGQEVRVMGLGARGRGGGRAGLPARDLADSARALCWLEGYAAASRATRALPVPARLTRGIQLHGVSFRYPGTHKLALPSRWTAHRTISCR